MDLVNIFSLFILSSLEAIFVIQNSISIFPLLFSLAFIILIFYVFSFRSKYSPTYLVNFSCYKPPDSCKVPSSKYIQHAKQLDFFDPESVDFMSKVLSHSGQGEQTYLPWALHYIPPQSSHKDGINEAHTNLFTVFEDLLSKTEINRRDIDVLIVNCSGFCPAPSLSAIIVNKYGLRENVKSYSVSGMGCSASAMAVDMASNIMKSYKECNAVVLSTEILSTGWYPGKERNKLVLNCMFRMGASAILLTNKKSFKSKPKYKLLHTLRTTRAFDDQSYLSGIREEDSDGITGFTIRKNLLHAVGELLRYHIKTLGTKILPFSEQILYVLSVLRRRFFVDKSVEIYVPNFKSVIQHFCLPTSGKPWIKEIGKGLKLGDKETEAALMTFHRYGNQSSSSLWYELAYMEGKEMVKKGDKVWQLGMGSGLKCTSLVWECVRPILGEGECGPWDDTISEYPI